MVHGLGKPEQDYSAPLRKRIERQRPDLAERLTWHSFVWYDLIAEREERLWHKLLNNSQLKEHRLRRLVLTVLATATSYQSGHRSEHGLYQTIQSHLISQLTEIEARHGDVPIFLIGHSFGVLVLCNYIWDWQHFNLIDKHSTPLVRLENTIGFASLASPLPIFQLSNRNAAAIRFPHPRVRDFFPRSMEWTELRRRVRWDNYFTPGDVLAYPLRELSDSYAENVNEDIAVGVSSFLPWQPMSHLYYWSSNNVAEHVTEQISGALDALELRR
ncbi:MAG: hypothetical protein ISN29_11040 [Gammaproteobacteria bacterium AqS3]|nr:hypothetical protein [Gammaproteobacteria bacterium AqS3]